MRKLAFPVVLLLAFLAGCAKLDYGIAVATDQMCTAEGQVARTSFRLAQDANFKLADKALCARCPGEANLQCTGDPVALPVVP